MALSLRLKCYAAGLLLGALGTRSAAGALPFPLGPQFQINTYTTSIQQSASVAADADGDFVVVWYSSGFPGGDTDGFSVQGQRYDSAGSALGSEFQVNTYTTNSQRYPSVAADADGDFVVVWQSRGSSGGDTSDTSIQGQRYDSAGSAVGSEFQVNTYTTNSQRYPSVAADADGDFVVVWRSAGSQGSDTSGFSVQGRRYDSAGGPVGSQFQVNTYTLSQQYAPSAAMDADGDFVVVWHSVGSSGSDSNGFSVQGQRYASAGTRIGSEFQVNTYTTNYQYDAAVATEADGDFVVVWSSYGSSSSDTSSHSVQGQRYDSAGSAIGSEFQVNTYTTSEQRRASVTVDAAGAFVVVWDSFGSSGGDTSNHSVQGQRYNSAGSPLGSQFQINTYTTSIQQSPSVASDGDGDFVVAWESQGSPGSDTSFQSIQGQRYAAAPAVPSLSPAALGAAALLMCLAVGIVLRRRI